MERYRYKVESEVSRTVRFAKISSDPDGPEQLVPAGTEYFTAVEQKRWVRPGLVQGLMRLVRLGEVFWFYENGGCFTTAQAAEDYVTGLLARRAQEQAALDAEQQHCASGWQVDIDTTELRRIVRRAGVAL